MTTTDHLVWEAPGPGSWTLAADHYPRPVTAAHLAFLDIWTEESTKWMRDTGLPISSAGMVEVNGFPYVAIVSDGPAKMPPAWVMAVALRVVPGLRRAEATLRRTFEDRPWVAAARKWYDHDRAEVVARMRALGTVDPDLLDDAALAAHLEACRNEWSVAAHHHIALHAHDVIPVCLFVLEAVELGMEPADAFGLLAGASPSSTGAGDEMTRLRDLLSGRHPATLEELRALGPDVSDALDDVITVAGWRLIDSYDVDGPCLVERPDLLLRLATSAPAEASPVEDLTRQGLDRVPSDLRDELCLRLEEARVAYGLRDDNGHLLMSWPTGLLRRQMLAAGRRLRQRGELDDELLAIEATPEELCDALTRRAAIDESSLRRRAAHRRPLRACDAPARLGPPEPPQPGRIPGALGTALRALSFAGIGEGSGSAPLEGTGIGDRSYEGRACLVLGAGDGLDEFEPGDVVVATMTSPSYNHLLTLAGALVTEYGGLMSHAAIMARELSLPAVVGAALATTRLDHGDRVLVDSRAGTVKVLEKASTR